MLILVWGWLDPNVAGFAICRQTSCRRLRLLFVEYPTSDVGCSASDIRGYWISGGRDFGEWRLCLRSSVCDLRSLFFDLRSSIFDLQSLIFDLRSSIFAFELRGCIRDASGMHQGCIRDASGVHRRCIEGALGTALDASKMH